MAINFPSSPIVGQTYQYLDREWVWNGTYWYVSSIASGGGGGGGGTGLGSRTEVNVSDTINANETYWRTIIGYKSYLLYKITTSAAAWVRLYTNESARSNDQYRQLGTDPIPGNGVIAEVLTTGATTQLITPATIGYNDDNPPTNGIYVAVTNKSSGQASIIVTLTINQLES